MKKSKLLVAVVAVLAVAFTVVAFSACGTPVIEKTYVMSDSAKAGVGDNYDVYQVHFLSDGTYELVKTTFVYGFSMNLGTYSVETFGKFTKGDSSDGYTAYELSEANRVILNAFSKAGGFNIYIDTATAEYPVEMPAANEGEKLMAQNAQDVIAKYGAKQTIYVSDTTNVFTLSDPNA